MFLHDRPIGTLERRGPSRYRFVYTEEVLQNHEEGDLVLSASLPVRAAEYSPAACRPFFEGLLPEGSVRETIAAKLQIAFADGFGLLQKLGAEVAGAVTVLPDAQALQPVASGAIKWLSEDALVRQVADLPAAPLGISADEGDSARLSLGGVQAKLVLTRAPNGDFGLPRGGAPSTHILKPGGDYEDVVANEAFCMRVARSAGLPTAKIEVLRVAGHSWLLVERFDRTYDDQARVVRVHQEDFCQALGREPASKYEQDGGPALAELFDLLRSVSDRIPVDVATLLRATVLNVILGNSDAHGKNFGLIYGRDGGARLAPLYDIVCTNVYDLTRSLAMSIGGESDPEQVTLEQWRQLARDAGLGGVAINEVLATAERLVQAARVTRELAIAEGWHRPVIDRIVALAEQRTRSMA